MSRGPITEKPPFPDSILQWALAMGEPGGRVECPACGHKFTNVISWRGKKGYDIKCWWCVASYAVDKIDGTHAVIGDVVKGRSPNVHAPSRLQ